MKQKKIIPLEEDEQIAFVDWLEVKNFKFSSIPNSTYTTSRKQKQKNTDTGLRKGLPDLLIFLSDRQSKYGNVLLFVEMKRIKMSVVSPEQKDWLYCLNLVDKVQCEVCYGFDEAKEFVEQFLRIK